MLHLGRGGVHAIRPEAELTDSFLSGRAALVTGGASGMGRAIALAMAGADVAIGSRLRDGGADSNTGEVVCLPGRSELEATAAEIEALGARRWRLTSTVASIDSVRALYDAAADRFGKVGILVNAAGITAEHTIAGHDDALWDRVIEVNLTGTYRTIAVGAPTSGAYCASKAAVVGLRRCVALEGAAHGVTCNAISPTWVETAFGRHWMTDIAEKQEGRAGEACIAEAKAQNPQGRLIQPREIGALALFLCRDEALGMTMQDLTVSAGSLW